MTELRNLILPRSRPITRFLRWVAGPPNTLSVWPPEIGKLLWLSNQRTCLLSRALRRPAVPNGGKNTSVVRLGGLFAGAFPSGLASARQGPFRSLNKWACLCEACLIWQTTRQSRHGGVSGRPPDRQAPRERMWSDESLLPAHQADEPGDGDDSV